MDEDNLHDAISEIEEQNEVSVLSARLYGSHAKNMAGPNSDYDVMLLFKQTNKIDYVRELGNRVDSIHTEINGMDFQCWDVEKFGSLLKDSNPQCLEFLNSPTEYRYREKPTTWLEKLKSHANEQFKPIALYYHYRDMAKSNYVKYLAPTIHDGDGTTMVVQEELDDGWVVNIEDDFMDRDCGFDGNTAFERKISKDSDHFTKGTTEQTVGRTLKVLRSIFYARHVRQTHTFPTMNFMDFMKQSDVITADDMTAIVQLIKKKRRGLKDEEIGNEYKEIIEAELRHEPDHEELNVRGIDRELVNEFIKEMIENGRDNSS